MCSRSGRRSHFVFDHGIRRRALTPPRRDASLRSVYRLNPHPIGDSIAIRRAYPLVARAIGFVNGEAWVARANWDRVEVRDEGGVLRFEHTIPPALSEGLLEADMAIADGHLACAIGSGIMPYGLRVWDLRTGECVHELETDAVDGPYVHRGPPGSSLVVVSGPKPVAVWDVARRRSVRTYSVVDPLAAAFDPATDRLAYCDAGIEVRDGTDTRIAAWSTGDVETLAWGAGGRWLVGTVVRGDARVWDAADGSLLATLEARGEILAASPCGRWLAFEDGLADLDCLGVRPCAASAAVFDPVRNGFVLANEESVWRVAVE